MIAIVRAHVIPAAYAVLPPAMASEKATRLMLATCWQESRARHRFQIGGPARGLWQFELGGGVAGVLSHPQTKDVVRAAAAALCYRQVLTPHGCYQAIEHNDIFAAVFARLLLWSLPSALADDEAEGWNQYVSAWRPGKPHPETWPQAWAIAGEET